MDQADRVSLRTFAAQASDAPFAVLLDRYLPFVYSAARRQSRTENDAMEMTRSVFLALAAQARGLGKRVVLATWLYDATRVAARRLATPAQGREGLPTTPASQVPTVSPEAGQWAIVEARVDPVVARLSDKLRGVFLLRFMLNWPVEVGSPAARVRPGTYHRRAAKGLRKVARRLQKNGIGLEASSLIALLAVRGCATPIPDGLQSEILAQAPAQLQNPRPLPLVQSILRGLGWLRWKRRLKWAGVAGGVTALFLGGLAASLLALWHTGRLLPWLIEFGARRQIRDQPELGVPARPWPGNTVTNLPQAADLRTSAELFQITNLWRADLRFSAEEWEAMTPRRVPPVPKLMQPDGTIILRNPKAQRSGLAGALGIDFVWAHAALDFSGVSWPNVGCRYRGNGTYLNSLYGMKRPFKVELNKFVKGQALVGARTLNFANLAVDSSCLSDALGYEFFRQSGVPAPRTAYAWVTLTVAGQRDHYPLGLYLLLEDLDGQFAEDRFGSKRAAIFKPVTYELFKDLGNDWSAYAAIYDPKTKVSPEQQQRVMDLARLLTHANDREFAAKVGDLLDLDEFARFLGGLVLLSSYDGFLSNGQNFYLYLDPHSNKLGFIPWDLDNAWGSFPFTGTRETREQSSIWRPWIGRNRLLERLMQVEEFRSLYAQRLEELLTRWFVPERLERRIDEVAALIRSPIAAESSFRLRRFEQSISAVPVEAAPGPIDGPNRPVHQIKRFITNRARSVRDQLDGKSKGVVLDGKASQ